VVFKFLKQNVRILTKNKKPNISNLSCNRGRHHTFLYLKRAHYNLHQTLPKKNFNTLKQNKKISTKNLDSIFSSRLGYPHIDVSKVFQPEYFWVTRLDLPVLVVEIHIHRILMYNATFH